MSATPPLVISLQLCASSLPWEKIITFSTIIMKYSEFRALHRQTARYYLHCINRAIQTERQGSTPKVMCKLMMGQEKNSHPQPFKHKLPSAFQGYCPCRWWLGAWGSADLGCLVPVFFSGSGLAYEGEVQPSQAKLSWQKCSEYSFIDNKLQHFQNISLGGFSYAVSSTVCWRSGVDFGAE